MNKARGFTLIELMITLVVIGILAAIAIPAYRQSVIKGNRRAAQSEMMEIVNRQQQYFVANRVYADEAVLACGLSPEVEENYDCDVNTALPAGPPPGFTITFTPTGGQVSDGTLTVNSLGEKTPEDKW